RGGASDASKRAGPVSSVERARSVPPSWSVSISDSDIRAPASRTDSSWAVSVAVNTPGRISSSFMPPPSSGSPELLLRQPREAADREGDDVALRLDAEPVFVGDGDV